MADLASAYAVAFPQTNPPDPTGVNAQNAGFEYGQKLATLHALQGVNLNDPGSVDNAITGLVHAGAGEQASALMNLNFTRMLRQQVPSILAGLTGQSSDQQQPSPAQAPAQPQADPQHVIDTFQQAKSAADQLLATPAAQRPAAFAQIKQQMLARGLPEAAIDAAGQDLSDEGLNALSTHYGALAEHAADSLAGNDAGPAPAAHPSNNWYDRAIQDPSLGIKVGLLKSAGLDLSPYLEQARALAMPGVTEAARAQYAGPIAEATKAAELKYAPALAGVEVAKAGATTEAQRAAELKYAGPIAAATAGGSLPYKIAEAKASADIAAGHDIIQIPEIDGNGNPTGRMTYIRRDVALGQAGQPGGAGRSQAPGEREGQIADSNLFMKNYESDANQQAIQADKTARDQARAGAALAQSVNPSNLTPKAAQITNTLNGLGFKVAAADANKLSTYQQIVAQNLKSGISVFPRNMAEFHAISNAVAGATQPGDAAALALTETAALRDTQAQYKQFRQSWAAAHPGEYSERAFQAAWAQQPQANQSIFASPLFQGLKFNGKPVVETGYQHNGHEYGIFMPGTKQEISFLVK